MKQDRKFRFGLIRRGDEEAISPDNQLYRMYEVFRLRIGIINRVSEEPIPEDEPVFILRARDKWAIALLVIYKSMVREDHHKAAVEETIDAFARFERDHPERMKEPGITRDFNLEGKL